MANTPGGLPFVTRAQPSAMCTPTRSWRQMTGRMPAAAADSMIGVVGKHIDGLIGDDRRQMRAVGQRLLAQDLAGIGRYHRRLAEVVKLATRFGADAFGAEIGFSHRRCSSEGPYILASLGQLHRTCQ